jgi:nucleotide-binding universal stress UspA family protein
MSDFQNRIIVAVGGEGVEAMMHFAAEEAVRSGDDLHLVHVISLPGMFVPELYADAHASACRMGRHLLDHAAAVARQLVDDRVAVTSQLLEGSGSTVLDLVSQAQTGRLLVVQHRHLEGLSRITATSTTLGVTARAHRPVVSVPEGWRPTDPPCGRVTVGISEPARSYEVLREAFEAARMRQARLRVAHSWWLANGYDTVVVDDDMRRDFTRRFRTGVAPHLERLAQDFPEVDVDVLVTHTPLVDGLLRAAEDSDVLVLGRRHWALPVGSHLGPVARAILRSAACPTYIVESTPVEPTHESPLGQQVHVMG